MTFDVDGTLVHGTGQAAAASVHAQSFGHAISKLFNNNKPITPVAEALPRRLYQGSTDGLILLRYAKATLGLEADTVFPHLSTIMECMYDYVNARSDDEITEHMNVLPGVLDHLESLRCIPNVECGLVTGNVEGIAQRKMEATGILATGALSPACSTQRRWNEANHDSIAFLGGFGSDYCSGDIDDLERNHMDRAEQIAIAAQRCQNNIESMNKCDERSKSKASLTRVVHVGDAPADVPRTSSGNLGPCKSYDRT